MSSESAPIRESDVLARITSDLEQLPKESQERILRAVATFFGVQIESAHPGVRTGNPSHSNQGSTFVNGSRGTPAVSEFAANEAISPKQFLLEKAPKTDQERIACLAFYLTHHRNMPVFKTVDISTLNTEAAQPKFSNAAQSVNNAAKTRYLTAAGDGSKQLTAAGEQFVIGLPDREAAKTAFMAANPRRSKQIPSRIKQRKRSS